MLQKQLIRKKDSAHETINDVKNKTLVLCVHTTVGFVRVILAVIVSITDVGRVSTNASTTLKLSRSAIELRY